MARIGPVRGVIDHRDRLDLQRHGHLGGKERRKQSGFERQHPKRIGASAFGKEHQRMPRAKPRFKQGLLALGLGPFAGDKDRACRTRQPADAGPSRDLGLGHEV